MARRCSLWWEPARLLQRSRGMWRRDPRSGLARTQRVESLIYRKGYEIYRSLYPALRPVFSKIAE